MHRCQVQFLQVHFWFVSRFLMLFSVFCLLYEKIFQVHFLHHLLHQIFVWQYLVLQFLLPMIFLGLPLFEDFFDTFSGLFAIDSISVLTFSEDLDTLSDSLTSSCFLGSSSDDFLGRPLFDDFLMTVFGTFSAVSSSNGFSGLPLLEDFCGASLSASVSSSIGSSTGFSGTFSALPSSS